MGKKLVIEPSTRPRKGTRRPHRKRSAWRHYGVRAAVAVIVALLARAFLAQGYRVPSRAMEDTLLAGEYVLVDKVSYGAPVPFTTWRLPGWARPSVGDVVVFRAPSNANRLYVKRCVAVGGQVVEGRSKVVYVDGQRIVDPPRSKYLDARILPAAISPRDNFGPVRVPADAIFVIGDNRDRSRDSRHWGVLPLSAVVGRAVRVYWSCSASAVPERSGYAALMQRLRRFPGCLRWNRIGVRVE